MVGTFPVGSHPPVTYPFAVTRRAEADARARALLAFLTGPEHGSDLAALRLLARRPVKRAR